MRWSVAVAHREITKNTLRMFASIQAISGLAPTFSRRNFSASRVLVHRVKQDLASAALRRPRFLEKAAREKESLLRARAPEAAVWVLTEDDLVGDACRLLLGFLKLERAVGATEIGFDLGRRLQKHVLALSPAVPIVRCFREGVGQPEVRGRDETAGTTHAGLIRLRQSEASDFPTSILPSRSLYNISKACLSSGNASDIPRSGISVGWGQRRQ